MKKIPRVGQTFYTISGLNSTTKLEKHFITSVKTSKLIETNIDFKSTFKGQDKNGLFAVSQELVREKRNHLVLLTRSGMEFDYSYGAEKLYFTKKQANKAYKKALKTYIFLDEAHSFVNNKNFQELLNKAGGLR
jgi:hypothetical protein